MERVKIDTSSLVCRWIVASTSEWKINFPLRSQRHATRFLNVEPPPISGTREDRHLKFDKCKYYSQRKINCLFRRSGQGHVAC